MESNSSISSNCSITLEDCLYVLSDQERELLYQNSSLLHFGKGEMVIRQDFSASHLYLLESGLISLNVFDDHRVSTVKLLTSQSFIGIMSSFTHNKIDFTATALQDSRIRLVEMEVFEKLIKKNGEFAYIFLRHLSELTNDMINWMVKIKGRDVCGALAMVLLEFSEIYQNDFFELPVSIKKLSGIIGFPKDDVIETLATLDRDGIVAVGEKYVEIIDSKRLQNIVEIR